MSPIQNSSQIQQQNQTSSPVSASPSQVQHKHQQMPRNLQSGCGMPNQVMKQRQRQQVQQQPKQQQQQRQQSQQQAKLMKGLGRGSMLMHQNLPVDASQVSGFSSSPKNQVSEKHLMQQGQGFFPGNLGLSSTLPQTGNQQKMYSRVLPQSSKQMTPTPSHSDTCNQGSVHGSPSTTMLVSQQPPVPSSSPLPNHLHHQQQQHQMNTSQQNIQRMTLQQNRQLNSDDSGTSVPVASSAAQWKPESYNVGSPGPTAHLANSPPENLVGTETIIPPSSQGSAQRQFSGSVSMHGNSGGQWQQQQPQPQQQQQRQTAQGTLYVQPSNSGPG